MENPVFWGWLLHMYPYVPSKVDIFHCHVNKNNQLIPASGRFQQCVPHVMHPGGKGSRWSMSHFVPMTIQGFSRFKGSNSSASSGKNRRPKSHSGVHYTCLVFAHTDGILGINHSMPVQLGILQDFGPGEASPPLQEPDRVGSSRCGLQHFSVGNRSPMATESTVEKCRK